MDQFSFFVVVVVASNENRIMCINFAIRFHSHLLHQYSVGFFSSLLLSRSQFSENSVLDKPFYIIFIRLTQSQVLNKWTVYEKYQENRFILLRRSSKRKIWNDQTQRQWDTFEMPKQKHPIRANDNVLNALKMLDYICNASNLRKWWTKLDFPLSFQS